MLQQMQKAMGDQATALRAEADARQQQIDAAMAAMQSSARPPTPPPSTTALAPPPAPAKAAARLASLFEAAEDPAPAALDAALLAALGPGEHSQLAAAVAAGDLPAATAILQSGDLLDFSARAGGGSGGSGGDHGRGSDGQGGGGRGHGGGSPGGGSGTAGGFGGDGEAAGAAEDLLDQLDDLEPGAADADASYADAFRGYPLPLPTAVPTPALPRGNPFPVAPPYAGVTSHYHPGRVGDPMHGALADTLEAKGFKANARELRTLVPTLRAQIDLRESLRSSATAIASMVAAGVAFPAAAAGLPQEAVDQLQQCDSLVEHLLERLAILRAIASGVGADVALFEQVYDGEPRMSGAMGRLEQRVDSTRLGRQVSVLTSTSARERAAAATSRATGGGARTQLRGPRAAGTRQPARAAPLDLSALTSLLRQQVQRGGGGGGGGQQQQQQRGSGGGGRGDGRGRGDGHVPAAADGGGRGAGQQADGGGGRGRGRGRG